MKILILLGFLILLASLFQLNNFNQTFNNQIAELEQQSVHTGCPCDNSVNYVGCRQNWNFRMGQGWAGLQNQMAKINVYTPTIGCIAITNDTSGIGHIALVSKVIDKNRLAIDEGDYPKGKCGTRQGTQEQLKIIGYKCGYF